MLKILIIFFSERLPVVEILLCELDISKLGILASSQDPKEDMDEVNKYFLIVVGDLVKVSASISLKCYKLLAFEYVLIGLMCWCGVFFVFFLEGREW